MSALIDALVECDIMSIMLCLVRQTFLFINFIILMNEANISVRGIIDLQH